MVNRINISDIPNTSSLIKDFLNEEQSVSSFYHRNLSYDNLLAQSKEKLFNYNNREVLLKEITNQLQNLDLSEKQKNNLEKLSLSNTVTITTGHQLNLMTGPLYFIYKILHTIKLCDSMNLNQKEINFVPIFWMATEDHDFQEINHFYFQNKRIEWQGKYNDFVGEIPTFEIKDVLSDFYNELKYFPQGNELRAIIEKSYFSKKNLAEATKVLIHELFNEFGLIIIDGNSRNLKKLFIPYIETDIKEQKSYKYINQTIDLLKSNYKIQVNPRKINFFYHENNERNRIDETNDKYYILGTSKSFEQEKIIKELYQNPEKFSPNALMRPVYQEVILPNVAYIGGNAEIAYWLELKKYFDIQNIPFPILIPRNSFLLLNENQKKRINKYQWKLTDIFKNKEELIKSTLDKNTDIKFDFSKYQRQLEGIFESILKESKKTDSTWENMILAQQKKQLNGLEKINKRFYKAERRKNAELVVNIENLYSEIFPLGSWQERIDNFSYFYSIYGKTIIQKLYNQLSEDKSVMNLMDL